MSDTTAARQAIAATITILTHNTGADPEWTARAIIHQLATLGWRPTNARKPPGWQPHPGQPAAPPTAEWRQARNTLKDHT